MDNYEKLFKEVFGVSVVDFINENNDKKLYDIFNANKELYKNKMIDSLNMSVRTNNCLKKYFNPLPAGLIVDTLDNVLDLTVNQLSKIRNYNEECISELLIKLNEVIKNN